MMQRIKKEAPMQRMGTRDQSTGERMWTREITGPPYTPLAPMRRMGVLLSCVAGKYKGGGGVVIEAAQILQRQKGIQAWSDPQICKDMPC
jgi:hypothetical protein